MSADRPPTQKSLRWDNQYRRGDLTLLPGLLVKSVTTIGENGRPQLDLDPDYQRGHVWTDEQAGKFVGYTLEGGESPTITLQEQPRCYGYEVVDGKQRITAVLRFLRNEIPAIFHDGSAWRLSDWPADEQHGLSHGLDLTLRARVMAFPTREMVIAHYLRLNAGGTVHTPEELARVRAMLDEKEPANVDIVCPECGGGVEWGESTCVPGAIGSASCYMGEPYVRADKRNNCRWTGFVIRMEGGDVRIATKEEADAHDVVVAALRAGNGWLA